MTNTTPPASVELETHAALLARSLRWLLAGWALAAVFAALALFQTVRVARIQNDVIAAHLEAEIAQTEAAQLRQQLEAERILAKRQAENVNASPKK